MTNGGLYGHLRTDCNVGGGMVAFLRLVVLALLGLCSCAAFASVAKVPSDAPGELCTASKFESSKPKPNATWVCGRSPSPPNDCGWLWDNQGYPIYNGMCTRKEPVLACPANSTENAHGRCDCAAGFVEEGGACVPPIQCPAGQSPFTGFTGVQSCIKDEDEACLGWGAWYNSWLNADRTGTIGSSDFDKYQKGGDACFQTDDKEIPKGKGCKVKFTADGMSRPDKNSPWKLSGFAVAYDYRDYKPGDTGFSCNLVDTPESPAEVPVEEKPPETCKNGYQGEVNGVTVCLERHTGETQSRDKDTKTDGNGNTTTTTTDVKCVGDACTTTTTINNVGADGKNTSSTTTNSINRQQYCAHNPKSYVCGYKDPSSGADKGQDGGGSGSGGGGGGGGNGEKSSFGGSCMAGFSCDGDAVQCAMAREQHKRNCDLFEKQTPEGQKYADSAGKEGDQTEDLPGNQSHELGGSISTEPLIGGGSCMPDLHTSVMGTPISIPFSDYCQYFQFLGYILVAFSLLSAVRIVGS